MSGSENTTFTRLLGLYNTPEVQNLISLVYAGMYFAGAMNPTKLGNDPSYNETFNSGIFNTISSILGTPFVALGGFYAAQTNIPKILESLIRNCTSNILDISKKLSAFQQYLNNPQTLQNIANAERVTLIISNLLGLIATYEEYNKKSSSQQLSPFDTIKIAGMTMYLAATTINHLYSFGVFKNLSKQPFSPQNEQPSEGSKNSHTQAKATTPDGDIIQKMEFYAKQIEQELNSLNKEMLSPPTEGSGSRKGAIVFSGPTSIKPQHQEAAATTKRSKKKDT
jgi:hypothetical protein